MFLVLVYVLVQGFTLVEKTVIMLWFIISNDRA
jgi:hypothetical protein